MRKAKSIIIVVLIITFLTNFTFSSIKTNNPITTYVQWLIWIKQNNYKKIITFFSDRQLEIMKTCYKWWNTNNEEMKKFLKRQGVINPDKLEFKSWQKMFIYILKKSERFIKFLNDVQTPIKKIRIDYYEQKDKTIYKEQLYDFFSKDYNYVRKLRLYLESDARPYIRRDLKGWYIDLS